MNKYPRNKPTGAVTKKRTDSQPPTVKLNSLQSLRAVTPPNTKTLLPKRKYPSPIAENKEEEVDNEGFQKPKKYKKFKTNFVKLIERKVAATIPTNNRYDSLSESESEQEQITVLPAT